MIAEKLRKAVLQAAMEGKLTKQLASDGTSKDQLEPKLLKYIIKENSNNYETPENWIYIKLKALIKLVSGRDLKTSEYNDKKNGIPYITGASNFFENSLLINRWTNNPKVISKKGDLLITVKGTIGLLNYNNIGDIHIARQIMAIKSTQINIDYLKYFLYQYVETLQKNAKSFIPGISRNDILDIVFPLPPRNEQKRIVEKLEVLLAEINKLEEDEKALKELEDKFPGKLKNAIIQAAIQGKLVDNSTKESAFNELDEKTQTLYMSNKDKYKLPFDIPNSWILMPIFQRYEFVKTGVSIYEGDKKYFSTGSIKEEFKPEGIYTFENRPSRANRLVLKGDIIEAKMSNTIKTTIVNEELDNQLVSTGFFQIRINSEITTKYVYYLLQSPYFTNVKNELSSGTTQKAINDANLSKIIIPIPSLEEQKRIVEKLDELFRIDLLNM